MRQTTRGPDPGDTPPRGQGSIEALILLIAALLVAAATAGVLFDVVGGFENEAATASEQSADQVVSRVEVVGATGHVNATNGTVEAVTLVLKRGDGGGNIDVTSLVVDTTIGNGASAPVDSTIALSLTPLVDDGESLDRGVIDSDEDRVALRIDLRALTGTALRPEEGATVSLLAPGGASTNVRLTVPSSLSGETNVAL